MLKLPKLYFASNAGINCV